MVCSSGAGDTGTNVLGSLANRSDRCAPRTILPVTMGQCRGMRWVRSLLVASLTACSAGLAHLGGGGHRAPVCLLVLLATFGTPAMHALSGRRWRFGHLAAVMGLTQIALHAAMTMTMPMAGTGCADASTGTGHGGHLLPTHHPMTGGMSAGMVFMHVGMTLTLAALLAHGERLLDWTVRHLIRLPRGGTPPMPRPQPMPTHRQRLLISAMSRAPGGSRAPPVAVVLL